MKSKLFHASAILPSLIRAMVMPLNWIGLPLGGLPSPSPVCLAVTVPPSHRQIAFGNDILNRHVDVRQRSAHLTVVGLESLHTLDFVSVRRLQAVAMNIVVRHFVDGRFAALIPDFFKPAVQDRHTAPQTDSSWVNSGRLPCGSVRSIGPIGSHRRIRL